MDRVNALRLFVAVVECGGFAKAARRRGISQSVVSQSVAHLEQELGCLLLHRSTRQVVLTDEGTALYTRCLPLIEELDDAFSEVASRRRLLSGVLRISAPATFGRILLAPHLGLFADRHPAIRIQLITSDAPTDLLAEGIDVGLRVGGEDSPNEVVKRLASSRIRLVGAVKYFEKAGVPSHPRELISHRNLVYRKNSNSDIWHFVGPEGPFSVKVPSVICTDNVDVIRTAVANGTGIAAMLEASITDELRTANIMTVLEGYLPWTLDIKAVWLKRRVVPQKVRIFVDFLVECLSVTPGIESDCAESFHYPARPHLKNL